MTLTSLSDNWRSFQQQDTLLGIIILNSLDSKGNYSATSNNTKLVHWPLNLMGGLLHLVQRGGAWVGWGHAQSPPRCGGAENAGQDIAGQDNDGQTSRAWLCRTGQWRTREEPCLSRNQNVKRPVWAKSVLPFDCVVLLRRTIGGRQGSEILPNFRLIKCPYILNRFSFYHCLTFSFYIVFLILF